MPERPVPVRETNGIQLPTPYERIANGLRSPARRGLLQAVEELPVLTAGEVERFRLGDGELLDETREGEPAAEVSQEPGMEEGLEKLPESEQALDWAELAAGVETLQASQEAGQAGERSLENELTALHVEAGSQAPAPASPAVSEEPETQRPAIEEAPEPGVPSEEAQVTPPELEAVAAPSETGPEEIPPGQRPLPSTRSDLAAWRAQVMADAAAIPTPSLEAAAPGGAGSMRQAGQTVRSGRRGSRGGLARQAGADRSTLPRTSDPPAPSLEETLVPEAAALVRAKSNRALTPREMPQLLASPRGVMPVLPQPPAPPGPAPASREATREARPAAPRADRNRRQADRARQSAEVPVEGEPEVEANPFLISVPTPEPPPPLPPVAQVAISGVVARLLAEPQQSAEEVLNAARRAAYNGVLPDVYPDIGSGELPELTASLTRELEQVAIQAGATREELAALVNQRRQELEQERERALQDMLGEWTQQCTMLQSQAQTELNQISGARQAADQATQQTLNLAQSSNDPQVVHAQRDRMRENLLATVAQQRVAYEQARQQMEGLLRQAGEEQIAAYQAVATREEQDILASSREPDMTPAPWMMNQSTSSPAEEPVTLSSPPGMETPAVSMMSESYSSEWEEAMTLARPASAAALTPGQPEQPINISLQLEAAETANWLAERRTAVEEAVRQNIRAAAEEAERFKTEVTEAGMQGLDRIADWAADLTGEQESWWAEFGETYNAWAALVRAETLAWETARASQTRVAVLVDFNILNQVQAQYGERLDEAAIQGIQGMSDEQRAVLRAYYSQDPTARNPIAAVAAGIQERVSSQRRQGLLDTFDEELTNKPDSEWQNLARLCAAENSAFNAAQIIDNLFDAMFGGITGWGTDEAAIFSALNSLTPLQSQVVRKGYRSENPGHDLDRDLEEELSDAELTRAQAQLSGDQALADAATLREAMHGGITGLGTDEDVIMRTLRNKSPEERERILAAYQRTYHVDLSAELRDELSSHDLERAEALVAGNQARADAIAIDQAMHGGIFGLGTDEAGIEAVYTQVREDVAAEALRHDPPWTTAQVEAEVQRRNFMVERSYNQRYAADYDPALGSALRQAYQGELSGPELDLANALANNDLIAADAARVAYEAQGIFYSDDVVINGVLDQTYNRALEEVRRDGQAQVRALEERARQEGWDDYRLAAERRSLERIFEAQAQTLAQERIRTLERRYNASYSHWSGDTLIGVISHNMSGSDQQRARTLLNQGYLTPAQQLYYAVQGVGTDEEAIRRALQGRTASEIAEIRRKYTELSPNETLDEALEWELSGRDEFDTHTLLQGEPENEDQEIAQMRKRMRYELKNSSGFLSSDQRRRMVRRGEELEQAYDDLRSTAPNSPKRRRALASFRQRSSFAQTAVEGYRRQVDSIADTLATAAAITAAIIVIVVATILTGGSAAAAAPGVLAAAEGAAAGAAAASATSSMLIAGISAAAGLAASMATRYAIRGAAYGWEDMGVDLAVGAVDIAASVATAGLGAALLRAGRLAQMATSRSGVNRFLARSLAEGAEGMVSSFPSSLTGNLLRDENWRGGNAFQNIALGTLMETGISTVASGVMGGVMGGGHDRPPAQRPRTGDLLAFRGTPQERLAQWRAFRAENPGASMSDFLSRFDRGVATRLADETSARAMQRELRGQLLSQIEPAQRRLLGRTPLSVLSEADFARLTRGQTGPLAMITEGGRLRILVREGTDPRILREEGQALARQVVRGVDGAPVDIRRALPRDLRGRVPVTIVPGLPGNTVRVFPIIDKATGLIRGVGMAAGPGASQMDLVLHARTARMMQRYGGLLGRAVQLSNRVRRAIGVRELPLPRTLAWELRLEVDKLPRIIRNRVRQLSQEGLSPAARRSLMEDISNLQRQLDEHTSALRAIEQNPALGRAPGRGYVAASRLALPARRDALAEADDLIRETAQGNTIFRNMIGRTKANPDLFDADSLRRIFAHRPPRQEVTELGAQLDIMLRNLETARKEGHTFTRLRQLVDGLTSSDATQRANAHFLLQRVSAGRGSVEALLNAEQILIKFSLQDINAVRQMHLGERFKEISEHDLFNALADLTRRVEGGSQELLDLINAAGRKARSGAPDPDLIRLNFILSEVPPGRLTLQQARDAIKKENELIEDLAKSGNEVVQRLFHDLNLPKQALELDPITGAPRRPLLETGVFASEKEAERYFRKRLLGIAGAVVRSPGDQYNKDLWRQACLSIRGTDLSDQAKVRIVGAMGEEVRLRMLQMTRRAGDHVLPQVHARIRNRRAWARIDHGIISVEDKTISIRLEDVKTGKSPVMREQIAIQDASRQATTRSLVEFDEDQIYRALRITDRAGYRIVFVDEMAVFSMPY